MDKSKKLSCIFYSIVIVLGLVFKFYLDGGVKINAENVGALSKALFFSISYIAGKGLVYLGVYGLIMTFYLKDDKKFNLYFTYSTVFITLMSIIRFFL